MIDARFLIATLRSQCLQQTPSERPNGALERELEDALPACRAVPRGSPHEAGAPVMLPSSRCQSSARPGRLRPRPYEALHIRNRLTKEPLDTPRRDGGARRDRTDDLMLAKHALSQLSYGPIPGLAPRPGSMPRASSAGEDVRPLGYPAHRRGRPVGLANAGAFEAAT